MSKHSILVKRSIAFGIAALMTVSLAGCGKNNNQGGQGTDIPVADVDPVVAENDQTDHDSFFPFGELFYDGRWYGGSLVEPDTQLNAEEVYANLTYTPQMFYGDYRLNHYNDTLSTGYATRDFLDAAKWWLPTNVSDTTDYSGKISRLPYRMVAGTAELDIALVTDAGHNWCELDFASEDGIPVEVICAYEIEGNNITFTPVQEWSYDEETAVVEYSFQDKEFTYEFSFSGPTLTFTYQNDSYTLIERDFTDWITALNEKSISASSSLSANSPALGGNIMSIGFSAVVGNDGNLNTSKCDFYVTTAESDGSEGYYNGIGRLDENGLFTFSYTDDDGNVYSFQTIMFYCGFDGMVLCDGEKVYYYLSTYLAEVTTGHFTPEQLEEIVEELGANLSEEDQELLETLTEEEVVEIIETRENLLADLAEAFTSNGIAAVIDEETGEIVFDSSILFATGQASLSKDGEAALTAFIKAFVSVIQNEKYDGFISMVEVQGHTDSDGDYDMNLTLSENRAKTVCDYSLTVEGLSDETKAKLESLLVPVGYSFDHPVLNDDGTENKAASRRVEFIFFINLTGR